MIMVILGAGASYDSVPSRRPSLGELGLTNGRPPLAAQLFSSQRLSEECLSSFPRCHPIVPYLQAVPSDGSVEHTLEMLRAEGDTDPERKCQIAAIRCYLQFLIVECERLWAPTPQRITNYVTLLDQLRRSNDSILLITFNYDRLIEHALTSLKISLSDFPDYISHDRIKLIKLHGSVNWAREVETEVDNVGERNVWEVMNELIERAGELQVSDRFRMIEQHPIGSANGIPLIPAIAIPVETKTEFECPDSHLSCLRETVHRVTKLLIIGWRGAENHFLRLLLEAGLGEVSAQIVADRRENAEDVLQRLKGASLKISGNAMDDEGFSRYVISRKAEHFVTG
jgi:SIR2-like domain